MKKILLVLLLLLVTVGVFGRTYYVSVDGDDRNPGTMAEPFRHIQYAVNLVHSYDIIIVFPGVYDENVNLDVDDLDNITIQSIDPENMHIVTETIIKSCDPSLNTISRTTSQRRTVINLYGLTISHGFNGVYMDANSVFPFQVIVRYCIFEHNQVGINFHSAILSNIDNTIFRRNYFAAFQCLIEYAENREASDFNKCLFYSNGVGIRSNFSVEALNCTFVNNNYGIYDSGLFNTYNVVNSIFYENETQIYGDYEDIDISYSCIEGGWEGEGNINADPLLDENYQPMWNENVKSPCIDTGNRTYGTDPDGTPVDIGAVHTIVHDYEKIDLLKWKWLCFPVLDNLYQFGDVARYMLADILDEDSYFTSDLEAALWREFNDLPGEERGIKWYSNDGWSNLHHEFTPTQGYKFKIQTPIITNMDISGWLASPEETIFPYLDGNREQWMGYFLEETLFCHEAFGNNWSNVHKIKAQEWSYVADVTGPSSRIRPLEYGKMYIVTFYEDVNNFQWDNNFEQEAEPFVRLEPQYFEYEEKANYEVIDILDIPEDVLEIGVYQDNRCVGAVVTDEDAEQILVYSDRMNRDETVFTFQLVYGRSGAVPLNNYTVYDEKVGDYVKGNIVAGKQDYSIIRFEGGEPTDPPQVMQLLGNFPNPFTGETTINFSLSAENMKNAEIEIFNIKGQKVENLQITNSPNQQIIWNANNFANGVYFYKLVVDGIAVDTKKMILLK